MGAAGTVDAGELAEGEFVQGLVAANLLLGCDELSLADWGRRAHQMWSVEVWLWRIDFSRADWVEMGFRASESTMR